jgi:glycosyltransferase involved in cell wall biosynthesis
VAQVSVVIPTRDRPRQVRLAVEAAAGQEDVDVEVLVVDDGSHPAAWEQVARLEGGAVRVFRHETSRGVSAARNTAIEHATSPWLAFLDDDDLWAPGKLAAQLAIAAQEGAGFVHTGIVVVDEQLKVVGEYPPPTPRDLEAAMARMNAIGTPSSVMARADLVREVGGFDERLSVLADWDLWLGLIQRTPVASCPEPLTGYTEHRDNMTITRLYEVRNELAYLARKHDGFAARHGGRLGGAPLEAWIAGSLRRSGHPWRAARAYLRVGVRRKDTGALVRGVLLLLGPSPMRAVRRARARSRLADPAWLGPLRALDRSSAATARRLG